MKTSEIKQGNKLIAEFMGGYKNPNPNTDEYINIPIPENKIIISETCAKYTDDLTYHSSWNWLMSVCVKILSQDSHILCESNGIKQSIAPYINATRPMKKGLFKCDINATWSGVIHFIKWYNQQT